MGMFPDEARTEEVIVSIPVEDPHESALFAAGVLVLSWLMAVMVVASFGVWAYVTQPGLKDCFLYGLPMFPLALCVMELTQRVLIHAPKPIQAPARRAARAVRS